jgi:hypothetical protein
VLTQVLVRFWSIRLEIALDGAQRAMKRLKVGHAGASSASQPSRPRRLGDLTEDAEEKNSLGCSVSHGALDLGTGCHHIRVDSSKCPSSGSARCRVITISGSVPRLQPDLPFVDQQHVPPSTIRARAI